MHFVGWDLSDPFSRRPRPVDVAVVEEHGGVRFDGRAGRGMPLWVDSTGWLREGRILDVRLPL